jgi:hypothetical protein
LDAREQEAQAANLQKTPEKRIADGFFWLAGHQVCGWSAAKIAEAENKKRRTVEKQIVALVSEINLTRRTIAKHNPHCDPAQIRSQLIRAHRLGEMVINFDIERISPNLSRILPPVLKAPFN